MFGTCSANLYEWFVPVRLVPNVRRKSAQISATPILPTQQRPHTNIKSERLREVAQARIEESQEVIPSLKPVSISIAHMKVHRGWLPVAAASAILLFGQEKAHAQELKVDLQPCIISKAALVSTF